MERRRDRRSFDQPSTAAAGEGSLAIVNIGDQKPLDGAVDSARPAVIFHLAAQSSVTRSAADPRRDSVVNVLGTLNVFEAASRHQASVVFSSTGGALYGDRASLPTGEDSAPAPVSPYGASKWAGEAYVVTWREATGLPHTVCRLGNVYGPRQSPHGEADVVVIFSHQLWRGDAPTIYGFGEATRDYVHVHDVARALLAAFGRAGVFNISTGVVWKHQSRKIFEVLQEAAQTALKPELAPLWAGELERSSMDPRRASEQLGWRAEIDLQDGLKPHVSRADGEFEAHVNQTKTGFV